MLQQIIDFLLLNTCTDMGHSRDEVALALLFASESNSKLRRKAEAIFEEELEKSISARNWNISLRMLLHIGLLANYDIMDKKSLKELSPYIKRVQNIIHSTVIHESIDSKAIKNILTCFLILSLYEPSINAKEIQILHKVGFLVKSKILYSQDFVTNDYSQLAHLYTIITIIYNRFDFTQEMMHVVISSYKLYKQAVDYSYIILINYFYPSIIPTKNNFNKVTDFEFINLYSIKDATNLILSEIICQRGSLRELFLSKTFINKKTLNRIIFMNKHPFSLSSGLARLLIVACLALKANNNSSLRNAALYIQTI